MSPKTSALPLPDLEGRRAVVTGASDGIGLGLAAALAGAGAEVVMPVRTWSKGEHALETIRAAHPQAAASLRELDLASLARSPRSASNSRRKVDRSTSSSTTPGS